MTNTAVPYYSYVLSQSWPGADNTNHYFNLPSDLFDPTKVEKNVTPPTPGFIERLNDASAGISTYDRYTFYRLLSQLGTDSEPEQDRINLNYANTVASMDVNGVVTNIAVIPNAETNLTPWQPLQFFTIAAERMLRLYTTNWFQENPTNYLATYYGITNYYGAANYYYPNPDGSLLDQRPDGTWPDQHSTLRHDESSAGVWHHEHSGLCQRPVCLFLISEPPAATCREHI